MTEIHEDGSIEGVEVIEDAQVTLDLPIESEGGDELRTLYDCVEEFTKRAKQLDLFVYVVRAHGRTFQVDWADRKIIELPATTPQTGGEHATD
jgi:hypothetical protein